MKRAFILIVSVVACGADGEGRRTLEPSDLEIVSGDHQTATVSDAWWQGGDLAVLSDTLVTQVWGEISGGGNITGPNLNVELPPGTVVEHDVLMDGCGGPSVGTVTPDADARTRTLWEIPGARESLTPALPHVAWYSLDGDSIWAARCEMQARLRVGTEYRAETTFVAYFQPRPAASFALSPTPSAVLIGDSLFLGDAVWAFDTYGNPLPFEWVEWSDDVGEDLWYASAAEGWDTIAASLQGLNAEMEIATVQPIGPGWTYHYKCIDGVAHGSADLAYADSTIETFTVDSVLVHAESKSWPRWLMETTIYGAFDYAVHYPDREPLIREDVPTTRLVRQRPGKLQLRWGLGYGETWDLTTASSLPAEYVGTGVVCGTGTLVEEYFRAPS